MNHLLAPSHARSYAAALAAFVVAAGAALAQTAPVPSTTMPAAPANAAKPQSEGSKRAHALFRKVDVNNDGKLSREEAQADWRLERLFDRIDSNKDSFVTPEEIRAARQQREAAKQKS